MADSELRHRKPGPKEKGIVEFVDEQQEVDEGVRKSSPKVVSSKEVDDGFDDYTPWVDVLRVLSFLFLASCALSYVISGGETFFWGMKEKPDYLTKDYWKEKLRGPDPPIYLTLEELARYDGTIEDEPVYLSINGTIYDVSNGRRIYGPGGSYHYFAGCDAARGFVTGCFAEDRTADMRGVEEMFLPIDDPEIDAQWAPEELAALKAKELKAAKKHVHDSLKHWCDFFARSKKYKRVGYLLRGEGWLDKEPLKPLCEAAQKGRSKRKAPGAEEEESKKN